MGLRMCTKCREWFDDNLTVCPHCGFENSPKRICLTCGSIHYGNEIKCYSCGFPIDENHNALLVSENELTEQKIAYKKEEAEVRHLAEIFGEKLEAYRDQLLYKWDIELQEKVNGIETEVRNLTLKLEKLGILAFKEKKETKESIEMLEQQLPHIKDELKQLPEAKRLMNLKIKEQTTKSYILTGDFGNPLGYYNALEKYLVVYKKQLERNNTDVNIRLEQAKDYLEEIISESKSPVILSEVVTIFRNRYPGYNNVSDRYLIDACVDLGGTHDGRIDFITGGGQKAYVLSKRLYHDRPSEPPIEDVFNPISDAEKISIVQSFKDKKGAGYNSYMQGLATKYGWKGVRDQYLEAMNRALRQETLTSMQTIINAQAAVRYSKKTDPALLGGAVSAFMGPVVGGLVAYKTALENSEKDAKRIKAELERDAYLSKNKEDQTVVNYSLQQIDILDYNLIAMEAKV